jgi:hypothetical protein
MQDAGDSIALLKAIKAIVYNFQSQKYRALAIHEGTRFYLVYQARETNCQEYLEKFQNCIDVLAHCSGTIGKIPGIMNDILEEKKIGLGLGL